MLCYESSFKDTYLSVLSHMPQKGILGKLWFIIILVQDVDDDLHRILYYTKSPSLCLCFNLNRKTYF